LSTKKSRRLKFLIIALRWAFILVAIVAPPVILFTFPQTSPLHGLDAPRAWSWIACLLGIAAIFVQAGYELQGRAFGVLIDERNRFSLSRLQVTLWSVLVLSTLYVMFVSNMVRAKVGAEPLDINMNWNLVMLMGISVATFVTAPMALSLKSDKVPDRAEAIDASRELKDKQHLAEAPTMSGTVVMKRSPRDARIADLIRGEEVGNATVVDITRTQMLIITVIVVTAYAMTVWQRIGFVDGSITQFPELSETVLGLIFISHAGYIGGKLAPTTRGEAGAGSPKNLARALQVSQRATDLVRNIELKLANLPAGSQAKVLQDAMTLARSAAAQAGALPTRVTEPNFTESEISSLEGRVEALSASVNSLGGMVPTGEIANSPAATKVLEVQRILRARGRSEVAESGIPDAPTESAILVELKSLGVDRKDLHPRAFRFYEEVAQILS